ncbi:MAG: elongation factor P-like protein YeiP [SAR86 cluster bacterium]|uniref:Elongation factor P-like protein n=1 Tax=SAR86 cluster bacterium TaxID=2030880 RepID=A0A2A5CAT5_9GAMM|nr:MAG: elongation factor P-like protein YeiP [SAR86 cluster bacterium]
MPKASELKRGMVIEINGIPHAVKQLEAKSPSSRGASTLYKVRFTNLLSKQKLDESYKGDDMLREADCVRVPIQFSYQDGDNTVFMNSEDYSQYEVSANELEGQLGYITDATEGMIALLMDGKLLSIELPQSINMEITETPPAIKGASASARTKPATLTTGLEVQVPEYLEQGEIIKINTTTGKFMSRA